MIANPLKIKDIISELTRGAIRIPELQRSYVWKRSQIAKLLDSLYRGFPTGSILLWDTDEPGQIRELATDLGRNIRPDFAPKIVLDGQQRLTSLGRVVDASTDKHERVIFNVLDEVFEPYSPRYASDARWIDVTELLTDQVNELDVLDRLWESNVIDRNDKEERDRIHDRLKRLT